MANIEGEGIPIPDVIDPPESMSVTLCVPKNTMHLAAFFGALYQLTLWNSWQRNGTTEGKQVADVWWRYFISWDQQINDIECEDGMAKCCTPNPEIKRFDPVTGRPQISYDDGVTWQKDPSDVQGQIQVLPPIVTSGGSKTKCDAATNASEHINELITATGENLSTASDVLGLGIAIAESLLGLFLIIVSAGSLTAPVVAVATAIWAAATSVFNLGVDLYNAYWTVDKQDAILCMLFCHIGENGQFTEGQYQAFRSEIKDTLPASPAFDIVMTAINVGGARGLSQMASYGNAAEADCSSCECPGCEIDEWGAGFWNAGVYYPTPPSTTNGTEIARDDMSVTIQSNDRGDGQQVISFTTMGGTKCCGFSAEWIGEAPVSVIYGFNYCGQHADYSTRTLDGAPFSQPFTMCYMQIDPGAWTIKFTIAPE